MLAAADRGALARINALGLQVFSRARVSLPEHIVALCSTMFQLLPLPVLLALAVVTPVSAAPSPVLPRNATTLVDRAVTTLSAGAIASFAPYTEFAAAAYCPDGIANWECGGTCL